MSGEEAAQDGALHLLARIVQALGDHAGCEADWGGRCTCCKAREAVQEMCSAAKALIPASTALEAEGVLSVLEEAQRLPATRTVATGATSAPRCGHRRTTMIGGADGVTRVLCHVCGARAAIPGPQMRKLDDILSGPEEALVVMKRWAQERAGVLLRQVLIDFG
ncbi:MAG: hypothetical protein V3S01_01160 [Dehalococcoidia bacterium]